MKPLLYTLLFVIGIAVVLALLVILVYRMAERQWRQSFMDQPEDLSEYQPVGDSGRRVIKVPPLPVKSLGVFQIPDGPKEGKWTILLSDGRAYGCYDTAELAREQLRLDNAKRT